MMPAGTQPTDVGAAAGVLATPATPRGTRRAAPATPAVGNTPSAKRAVNLDEVMQMIEKNIFRPLPNVKKSNLGFSETGIDQEEEMDPAWPHLQGIYEFFLQLVINESVEVRSLKVYVTPQFVQEFLELFDSEESVERDYLKNILHKLYAKVSFHFVEHLMFASL